MGRKRLQQSKLALLDKAKSRKMKGLFGAAPPAPLPEQYYAGGCYHQGAPVYAAAARAPFVCSMPPLYPGYPGCLPPPLSVSASQPPGAPLVDAYCTARPPPDSPGERKRRSVVIRGNRPRSILAGTYAYRC